MSWLTELFESLASNHPELENAGFAHVANVGKLQFESAYSFEDGLELRKASSNETETLRNLVHITRPVTQMKPTRNPYETKLSTGETMTGGISHSIDDLAKEEWRYTVIAFDGWNDKLHDLIDASILTPSRIELGPTVFSSPGLNGPGFIGGSALGRLWDELDHSEEPLCTLRTTDLDDVRHVYRKLRETEDDMTRLRSAMKCFVQLDNIPKKSPLRFLGYVSILESMITHNPKPSDPYDSLTRQVRQKMLLIGRRSSIPIPYDMFDGDSEPSTIWNRLYDYRSAIAHGATPDFSKRHKCLNDSATATEFISRATTAVLRQALDEPELIADVRAC